MENRTSKGCADLGRAPGHRAATADSLIPLRVLLDFAYGMVWCSCMPPSGRASDSTVVGLVVLPIAAVAGAKFYREPA